MAKHNVAELLVDGAVVCRERIDHAMSVRVFLGAGYHVFP
jgi:hypothetical protein